MTICFKLRSRFPRAGWRGNVTVLDAIAEFEYSALGTCAQTGTVSFIYGGKTKSLAIANVGGPQLQ